MADDTTHVRMYESDKEWLNNHFEDGSMAAKLARIVERYKTETQE